MEDYMRGFTEIGPCEICEDKGWIMIDKAFYKEAFLRDGTKNRSYAGNYNTVYNCTCGNEQIHGAKTYRDAGINLGNYEKDYAGRYMRKRSA